MGDAEEEEKERECDSDSARENSDTGVVIDVGHHRPPKRSTVILQQIHFRDGGLSVLWIFSGLL
jgi:hypothetical protein